MFRSFLSFLSARNITSAGPPVILAVSGGRDSMVMLHLFQSAGIPVCGAHVNFKLRGEASDEDERHVIAYCDQQGIAIFTRTFDVKIYARAHRLSTQMAARALRYAWFEEIRQRQRAEYIATAHHLNDAIETAMLNLARGAGIESLAGIADEQGRIIRPLLTHASEEIEQYAASHGITWREDATNARDDYQRNFVRHHIIPLFKTLNPSLEKSFLRHQQKSVGAISLLRAQLSTWEKQFTRAEGAAVYVDKQAIIALGDGAWQEFRKYGLRIDQFQLLKTCLRSQDSVGKTFFTPTHVIVIDREYLQVKSLSATQEKDEEVWIAGPGNYSLREQDISIAHQVGTPDTGIMINADKIAFPIQWRHWKAGDYFIPSGMRGRKKVSDFIVDQKISRWDKQKTSVLVFQGDIICVVGHRVDERYKAVANASAPCFCVTLLAQKH